jgi:hypothetical protein
MTSWRRTRSFVSTFGPLRHRLLGRVEGSMNVLRGVDESDVRKRLSKVATSASTACESSARAPLRKTSVSGSENVPGWESWKTLLSVTAYHSFRGEVGASNTTTIRRLTLSCRHQLSPIARDSVGDRIPMAQLSSPMAKINVRPILCCLCGIQARIQSEIRANSSATIWLFGAAS